MQACCINSLVQVLTFFPLFLLGFLTSVLAMVASALASPSPCGRCPSTSLTDERMLSLMKLWPDVLWSLPAAAWTPSSSLTTSSTTISGGITRQAKLPSRWRLMLHGNNFFTFKKMASLPQALRHIMGFQPLILYLNFFFCLPLGFLPCGWTRLSGDGSLWHLAQPYCEALGRALICMSPPCQFYNIGFIQFWSRQYGSYLKTQFSRDLETARFEPGAAGSQSVVYLRATVLRFTSTLF